MYGAIYGDLAGSIYEYAQLKKIKSIIPEELIMDNSFYSDDTILTIAILDAILHDKDYDNYIRKYIKKYKDYKPNFEPYFKSTFSPDLIEWSKTNNQGFSWGNGAMMRISPVGFMFDTEKEVIENAKLATIPSHNSTEAIRCAINISLLILYLRNGYSKDDAFNKLYLNPTYVPFTKFNIKCSDTIGNCLYAFYNSNSFEDAIKKTLMMGGDTDTNCAIVGSIAEASYGIDDDIVNIIDNKIPKEFKLLLKKAYNKK